VKINPLYLGLLLVVALLFVIYQLGESKAQLRESKEALYKIEAMAEEIDALKRAWDNPKTTNSALNRILKAPQLKSANIQKKKKRGHIILSSKKADLKATNYFFVKLFNGAFVLEKFQVKRLDDESVSFSVEIRT
jgi:hypothetical protein